MPVTIIDNDDLPQRKRKSPAKTVPDGIIPWSFPCKESVAVFGERMQGIDLDEEATSPEMLPGFMQRGKPPAGACRCPN